MTDTCPTGKTRHATEHDARVELVGCARPRIVITPAWGDDAAFEAVISGITTKGNE